MNKNYNGVRIVLGEKKATVKAEAYCKTGEDFTEIFPRLYGQFDKIAREFKKVYNKELEIAQTLEEKEAEEAYKNRPASELVGQVKEVKFRLCDKDKNPTTTFGAPLKSAGTGYIQASFTLAPRKAADKSYDLVLVCQFAGSLAHIERIHPAGASAVLAGHSTEHPHPHQNKQQERKPPLEQVFPNAAFILDNQFSLPRCRFSFVEQGEFLFGVKTRTGQEKELR